MHSINRVERFCFFFHQLCCWNHSGDKKLLTPQPRLRTGFFSVLESQMIPTGCIPEACTSVGAAKYGRPIGLDERIKVDLIVIGSVAVDPSTGARLGKGEVIIVEELNQSWFCCLFLYHDNINCRVHNMLHEKKSAHKLPSCFSFFLQQKINRINCWPVPISVVSWQWIMLYFSRFSPVILSMNIDSRDLLSWNMGCFVIWEL